MRNAGVVLALAVLALGGCAEDLPTVRWSKPAASHDEFVQDRADCARYAREQAQPFYLGGNRYAGRPDAVESALFVPCMAQRGWHEDPKGYAAPPDDTFALWP
jgi:hypothetical protein